jgi:hypothetical protein
MMRARSVVGVEADLIALKIAAERAGTALACLFSSADEYEDALIRERRAEGRYRRRTPLRTWTLRAALSLVLVFAFLML